MNILLIGPPAGGKSTIGKLLSEKINLPLVTVGKLLRAVPKDSEWYEHINKEMDAGRLVTNSVVGNLIKEHLKGSRYENGFILDGWLRQFDDLNEFDPKPDIVLFINCTRETSTDRILSRRVCKQQGHVYNMKAFPPKIEGICDLDGSKLIIREDDNEQVLNHRWEIHETLTKKVLGYYKNLGLLVEIDGNNDVSAVFRETFDKLNKKMLLYPK